MGAPAAGCDLDKITASLPELLGLSLCEGVVLRELELVRFLPALKRQILRVWDAQKQEIISFLAKFKNLVF